MHINSLTTYYDCVLPHLTEKQQEVLKAIIDLGKATDEQIVAYLNTTINNVSNRVGDLEELKLIDCSENEKNSRNRNVRLSKPNDNYKMVSIGETINHLKPEIQNRIYQQTIQKVLI